MLQSRDTTQLISRTSQRNQDSTMDLFDFAIKLLGYSGCSRSLQTKCCSLGGLNICVHIQPQHGGCIKASNMVGDVQKSNNNHKCIIVLLDNTRKLLMRY